jgi:hypothetical protein
MEGLKIKVRHVEGRTEELVVESDQVLIGSGAHCEVRLPLDQARFEHVVVRATHAGLFAAARSLDPPPTLNGAEFTEAPMLPGSVLGINRSVIQISQVALLTEPSVEQKETQSSGKRPIAIAIFGIVAALAMILLKSRQKDATLEPKQVPQLFTSDVAACPQASGSQAKALAESKLSVANTKRERSPFHVEDGVRAVPLYQLASVCFRAAGQDQDAKDAALAAERLKARVADEFRTHRVRFQYALGVKDWKLAQDEVRTLRAYTSIDEADGEPVHRGPSGEYAAWLSNWERKIELTQGGKKK